VSFRAPRFDLDEGNHPSVVHHDVDLTAASPEAALDHGAALPLQETCGVLFRRPAEGMTPA